MNVVVPMTQEEDDLAKWLRAALDHPMMCDEFKTAIQAWFDSKTIAINKPSEEHTIIEEEMWDALGR